MPTTIKLKNSVTTTNAPSSLAQGEIAINITDKKVWVGNAATTPIQLLGAGGSASFGALTCTSLTNSGLTSGRVTYATTGGLLTDSANLTFNGTTLTAAALTSTGVATFSAGTVSAPAITTSGDTNTGIFFPAADTIAFTEGGVESMRLDSNGRLGIGTTSPTTPLQVNGTITATSVNTNNTFGFKNRIINGAMVIDQRNAGASVTPAANVFTYTLDRWSSYCNQASKFTVQQNAGSVTPPVGFSNYLGAVSSSAYSVTSTDIFALVQFIEGFNTADLAWGTANAKTVTLSFQVYSSLTGSFGGALMNSAQNRSYPFSYTVSSANTWTTVSVTIAGDTSGTWIGATNGKGLGVWFSLGCGSVQSGTANAWAGTQAFQPTGSVSVVGTNGATFYITGVQLEVGSTATSFDYRPYGTELALCQRYYHRAVNSGSSGAYVVPCFAMSATDVRATFSLPVTMRAVPTLVATSGSNYYDFFINAADRYVSTLSMYTPTTNYVNVYGTTSGATGGQAGILYIDDNSASIAFSSEL